MRVVRGKAWRALDLLCHHRLGERQRERKREKKKEKEKSRRV